jgi:hypothetical protein
MRTRSKSVAWGNVVPLAALLLLVLIAARLLWEPGLLNTRGGGDSPFLLLRTHQLAANLRAGFFPVRWMSDAAYGFGYPFFNYYAALPYYLAAGFTLFSLDILSAIKLTQTLFFVASALGMYGWARRILRNRAAGWLAAMAYTFAPYHLVNVYVRGDSLSEFAAFAFFPLILWGLDHLAAQPSIRRVMPSSLAYAALILTHNLSAFIFSPFILLYVACRLSRFELGKTMFRYGSFAVVSLFIGFLLSAWFFLPSLAELDYVQMIAQTTGYFFYGNHFRGMDLIQSGFIFDYTYAGDTTPFAMGLVQAILALGGIVLLVARRASPRYAIRSTQYAFLGLALSTWLVTPLSRPLWDRVPLLQIIQFPWRFLSVQAFFAALLIGAIPLLTSPPTRGTENGSSPPMGGIEGGRAWIIAVALAVLLAVAGLAGLQPEYLPITADEVTVERLQLYELFTGNIGSTIRHEWLPHWVTPRPYTGPALFDPAASPRAVPLSGEMTGAEEITHEPIRRVWTVEVVADGAEIAFPLYYWPGWRATVDGAPVEVKPAPDSGYLTVKVPAGEHTVAMWLGRTPLRLAAELTSLITALILIGVWVIGWRKDARCKMQDTSRFLSLASCLAGLVVAFALLITIAPRVTIANDSDLTMDFDEMPYLHHNPGGVDFAGWRMTGYRYSADRLAPGETLQVTFDWEAWQGGNSVTLRLVSPAAIRNDELPAVTTLTAQLQPRSGSGPYGTLPNTPFPTVPWPGSTTLELSIPRDAAPGLYLICLEGEPSIYLRPVWVGEGEKAAEYPVSGAFADDALRLHTVEIAQPTPDQLDVQFVWSAARPVAANYGLSLRLTDPAGNEWARQENQPRYDTQPGYGFLPTSLWPIDDLIHDHHVISLPAGAPPGDNYVFTVSLYRVAARESVGEFAYSVSLTGVTLRPDAPVVARFGDEIALSRLEAPERVRQGETLRVTAYWLTVEPPLRDYIAEWRLEMGRESIVATLPLAPGSSPTAWPAGAWIAGRAALPVSPTAPPGDYVLSLTLHDPGNGASLGSYTFPQPVRVRGRERVWELPPMQQEVGASFGGMIELAGYDLRREGDNLRLMLYWRALEVPDQHYMLFVHLADPATGWPVTQVDTMPRGFTYPTGMWAPGEIVADEVILSLEEVPAGRYDLAVGWYVPSKTEQRLSAIDRQGNPLSGDRLVLPDDVALP